MVLHQPLLKSVGGTWDWTAEPALAKRRLIPHGHKIDKIKLVAGVNNCLTTHLHFIYTPRCIGTPSLFRKSLVKNLVSLYEKWKVWLLLSSIYSGLCPTNYYLQTYEVLHYKLRNGGTVINKSGISTISLRRGRPISLWISSLCMPCIYMYVKYHPSITQYHK